MKRKLSASSLSTFLKSPKKFYWAYVVGLVPIQLSAATYDHDMIFGQIWAEITDRFYKGMGEEENIRLAKTEWEERTDGWVPEKQKDSLTRALDNLAPMYYQLFDPLDGCRAPDKSELWVENDRFCGKLDGLSNDGIIHEVKSTSRAKSMIDQHWKVENSLQVRLYGVLAQAKGIVIEFAFKDTPNAIQRNPVKEFSENDLKLWEQELNTLADFIYSLGDDPYNYPCHPDGCCITSKFMSSICSYQLLCEQGLTDENQIFYKVKESQQSKQRKGSA